MVLPQRSDLVVVQFPFSDLTGSKLRPGVVVGVAGKEDFILCQLTSRAYLDGVEIDPVGDVSVGKLRATSYARPLKLFTANRRVIKGVIGKLSDEKLEAIVETIIEAIQPDE